MDLEQRRHEEYVFPDGSYRFAVLKTFQVRWGSDVPTEQVVEQLMGHIAYRDDYQAPGEKSLTSQPIHGPYRLDALSPASYVPVSAEVAGRLLDTWLDQDEEQLWGGPGAEAKNAEHKAGQPAVRAWFAEARKLFDRGDVLYLSELGEERQHESGWTLWQFEEWLVWDRAAGELFMLTLALD